MTTAFQEIRRCFFEYGLELETPEADFLKGGGDKEGFEFRFRGPCGHFRKGTVGAVRTWCEVCMPAHARTRAKSQAAL
jgi:hypothetical protein